MKKESSAPLFLRKLVLGIPAQASGKNHVAINAFGAPIRPASVSLRHIIASSMLTP